MSELYAEESMLRLSFLKLQSCSVVSVAIARHITEDHSSNGAKAAVAETENIPDSSSSAVRRIDRENKASESSGDRSRINVIAQSRWSDGVPAVMGAHLMASGVVAPLSTSKGFALDFVTSQVPAKGCA